MSFKVGFAKAFWISVPIVVAGLAVVLLAASFLPYATLKPRMDALAADGRADLFTPDFHAALILRARGLALCLLAAGLGLGLSRRWLERQTPVARLAVKLFVKDAYSSAASALASDSRVHLSALGVLLALTVAVRIAFLFEPIRYDEAFTFTNYASKPLYVGLSSYTYPNNHLFHTFLVHIASRVFGGDPWAIRLPALVAGVLLVPAAYLLLRIVYDKHVALLCVGLVAVSAPLVVYSTNARGYSLIGLIFLLLLVLAVHLQRSPSLGAWVLFCILTIAGFYAIPVMLYPWGAVVVWMLLEALVGESTVERKRLMLDLVWASAAIAAGTALLYSPVLLVSGADALIANRFVAPMSWSAFVANVPGSLSRLWAQWNHDVPTWLAYVLSAGFLLSLGLHSRLAGHRVPIPLAAVCWCVPLVVAQRVLPFERVWLFLLPIYLGGACAGLAFLATRLVASWRGCEAASAVAALGLSAVFGFGLLSSPSINCSQDAETLRSADAIAGWLKQRLGPDDRIVAASPADAPLVYYLNRRGVPLTHLAGDFKAGRRIVVVVSETDHQTVEGVLNESRIAKSDLSEPKALERFEDATLYEARFRAEPRDR